MWSTLLGIFFVIVFFTILIRFIGQSSSSRTIGSKQEHQNAWQSDFHSHGNDHGDGGGSDGGGE
ncbi:hypothetical protein [Halobacillus sp. H74]|uniref:hypothetical protein n=1 Tax=Halobacillus sp. H74 TaxID=3457436 RepID=UPI003FCC8E9D